ncbi:sensor histidine kinase [Massilia sp. G4R7]|uniref:histidine kinase n=1 Tax=Massilia phyllostachyos TaxID=2898585 RepID=A0ABS8Q4Y7_9BURK|nr:sensor histidine kinase [Massilia phyllostachyos]MCD2516809.1 sensor histidine kinase [Massilia phyllostachyos]
MSLPFASPELLGAALLTLAAAGVALLQGRRMRTVEERSEALEEQLATEKQAHAQAAEALAGSHEVLCRLVRQQEGVRDIERTRIARALHDELGQRLLSLRAELSLQQVAARSASPANHERLGGTIANLDAAIRSVRAIVSGMRPIAPGLSLRQALERHLTEFARLHGLDYRLDLGVEGNAGGVRARDLDAVLFRALQEALSNVACHAQASAVRVTLVETAGEVTLTVEDDGVGPAQPVRHGHGLEGMQQRATACGGTVRLSAGRRGGAVVRVSLPTHPEAAPA